MRRLLLPLVALLSAFAPGLGQDRGLAPPLPAGLSPDAVRARLGPPSRISRQIHAHRSREQWHYDSPLDLRLEFDCPRGQVPRLSWSRPRRAP